jgi:hypothetical protein
MASYADLPALESWLSAGADSAVTLTGDDEAALQLLLDAATSFIERYTGRLFRAEAATTKDFYATNPYRLPLPDIRTITSLLYDSTGQGTFVTTLTEGVDYFKTPLVPFPDAGIYTGVEMFPYSSRGFWGQYRVRILGDWGYVVGGAAPPSIQLACLLLAGRYWQRKSAPLGIVQNVDIGTFRSISAMDLDVKTTLELYKAATVSPAWMVV